MDRWKRPYIWYTQSWNYQNFFMNFSMQLNWVTLYQCWDFDKVSITNYGSSDPCPMTYLPDGSCCSGYDLNGPCIPRFIKDVNLKPKSTGPGVTASASSSTAVSNSYYTASAASTIMPTSMSFVASAPSDHHETSSSLRRRDLLLTNSEVSFTNLPASFPVEAFKSGIILAAAAASGVPPSSVAVVSITAAVGSGSYLALLDIALPSNAAAAASRSSVSTALQAGHPLWYCICVCLLECVCSTCNQQHEVEVQNCLKMTTCEYPCEIVCDIV